MYTCGPGYTSSSYTRPNIILSNVRCFVEQLQNKDGGLQSTAMDSHLVFVFFPSCTQYEKWINCKHIVNIDSTSSYAVDMWVCQNMLLHILHLYHHLEFKLRSCVPKLNAFGIFRAPQAIPGQHTHFRNFVFAKCGRG